MAVRWLLESTEKEVDRVRAAGRRLQLVELGINKIVFHVHRSELDLGWKLGALHLEILLAATPDANLLRLADTHVDGHVPVRDLDDFTVHTVVVLLGGVLLVAGVTERGVVVTERFVAKKAPILARRELAHIFHLFDDISAHRTSD